MSDFILKIFPAGEVSNDKTQMIKEHLTKFNFLSGDEVEYYGENYLKAGAAFCDYFEFEEEKLARESYKDEVRIKIVADGYGVVMEEDAEEPEFVDRKNVIEIWNVDGNYTGWDKLTRIVSEATGDEYVGEWEIL